MKYAVFLAVITVGYNLIEGIASVFFGHNDHTLVLLGFGLDSFVEVISGIGIWHMILRIRKNEDEIRDTFEKRALNITGFSFFLLTVGLVLSSVYILWTGVQPETTFWGVVISGLSLGVMWWLIREKKIVGKALKSNAIIADAHCTRTCLQLSVVLLAASLGYELFKINSIDAVGSLLIAGISFREGRGAFEKARNADGCCD